MSGVINEMVAAVQAIRRDGGCTFAVRNLPVSEKAPGLAREWVGETLTRWGDPVSRDDVASVLTELISNAVKAGAEGLEVLVEWHYASARLEVCVWDDAPGLPVIREPDFEAEDGRGLHMVGALSAAWGHRPAEGGTGKVVWAAFEARG